MKLLFTDTETRSRVPISYGIDLYTRAAECTIVTYALNDSPVQIWQPWDDPRIPSDLEDYLADEEVVLIAHNAPFDYNIFLRALQISLPIERWRDTRVQAYSHGLPGALETLGVVLELPQDEQKLIEDKKLIHLFCEPQGNNEFVQPFERPDEWEKFCRYAMRDTDSLRSIYRRMAHHNYSGKHLSQWFLDQRINARGFQFDANLATATVDFLDKAKRNTDADLTNATDGLVSAATQRNRLLDFLQRKYQLAIPNLRAAEIREWLEHDDISPEVRFLLETRLEAGKSSGAKYKRGLNMLGPNGRMRFTIQMGGAGRTGRFSGKGFQPHNMARPMINVLREFGPRKGKMELVPVKAGYIDDVIIPGILTNSALSNKLVYGAPTEAAALALRHVIIAAPSNELVVADWSNIESRVIAWIAGESWKLDAYRAVDEGRGVDLYKLLFSQFFGIPVDQINDTERQSGKVSELAFSFGGGVGALVTMAATYQMDLDPLADLVLPRAKPEMLKKAYAAWRRAALEGDDYELEPRVYQACDILKQTYRESNKAIDRVRYDLDAAIKTAIADQGRVFRVARCRIWSTGTWLIIELPSGRRLLYSNPKLHTETDVNPDTGKITIREYVSYATARGKSWRREKAWPGIFVENIVQAIANDILRGALLRVDADTKTVPAVMKYLLTLPFEEQTAIAFHVHDEVILDVPVNSYSLARLIEQMIVGEDWSIGLPLSAEGWVGPRYGKRDGKKLKELLAA